MKTTPRRFIRHIMDMNYVVMDNTENPSTPAAAFVYESDAKEYIATQDWPSYFYIVEEVTPNGD